MNGIRFYLVMLSQITSPHSIYPDNCLYLEDLIEGTRSNSNILVRVSSD